VFVQQRQSSGGVGGSGSSGGSGSGVCIDAGQSLEWVWSAVFVDTSMSPAFMVGMLPFALLVLACGMLLQDLGL
jgi:hypothetical protein